MADKLKILYYVCLNIYNGLQMSKLELRRILPPLNEMMPLELETALIVNSLKFTLPDIASIGLFSEEFEKWIWNYLKVQEGEVFLDVGAHVGKYTLLVARLVGKSGVVIAVEPSPKNYKLLLKNIRENGVLTIIDFAISNFLDLMSKRFYKSNGVDYRLFEVFFRPRGIDRWSRYAHVANEIRKIKGKNFQF